MTKDQAGTAFKQIFGGRVSTAGFYDRLEAIAKQHRDRISGDGPTEARRFVDLMQHKEFAKRVANKVRVKANKAAGEKRGTGPR